ncbi:MAG: ThuA domain-containing protein [Bacteroidota bacterium]|nr:ThuA domain-containing protein [Bacteroidota bacterium]
MNIRFAAWGLLALLAGSSQAQPAADACTALSGHIAIRSIGSLAGHSPLNSTAKHPDDCRPVCAEGWAAARSNFVREKPGVTRDGSNAIRSSHDPKHPSARLCAPSALGPHPLSVQHSGATADQVEVQVNEFAGDRPLTGRIGQQSVGHGLLEAPAHTRAPTDAELIAQQLATDGLRDPVNVLMVTTTHGFRHGPAIEAQKEVMLALSETTELRVDTTEDLSRLRADVLADYDVLFLANSTLRAPRPEGVPEPEVAEEPWGTFANYDLALLIPDNAITGTIALSEETDSLIGSIRFSVFPTPAVFERIQHSADSLILVWDTGGMGMARAELGIAGDSLSGMLRLAGNEVPVAGGPSAPPARTYALELDGPQGIVQARLRLDGEASMIAFPEGTVSVTDLVYDSTEVTFMFDTGTYGVFHAAGTMDAATWSGTITGSGVTMSFEAREESATINRHEGPVISEEQMQAVRDFLEDGKGLAVAHAGLDAFYNWDEYREAVGGGLFVSHPWTQEVRILIEDKDSPATRHFGDDFRIHDEIYVLDENPRWNARVLMSLDTKSVELQEATTGNERNDYPISWIRWHNGGRVFVTKLGHFAEVWKTPAFVEHVVQGLRMAAGRIEASFGGYREKEVIADDVWPDDIAVDDRGNVWIAELRGKVHHYDAESGAVTQIAALPVTDPTNVEHGLYGIEVDPEFYAGAPYIYLYYAEPHTFINTLSRFTYRDGALDLGSEHVLLRVPTEPQCCHQGGDLEWGLDSTLFLSTGDTGMSEVRPGWKLSQEQLDTFMQTHRLKDYHWSRLVDSERSAQNLQDLRGKILRIHRDGSIPKDNPFFGTPGVRWEIYAYGLRNPYRFKVDDQSGALYIGVVGPDASFDYDEYNVAARGGENFGWPRTLGRLFYNEWTPEMIPDFVPPFWDYTYEHGGRSATIGPVYRSEGPYAFPQLQNTVFVYDWARRWIKYGRLTEGTFVSDRDADVRMDPPAITLPALRLTDIRTFDQLRRTAPISMELAPDGSLYVAEFDGFWDPGPNARVTRYRWIRDQ